MAEKHLEMPKIDIFWSQACHGFDFRCDFEFRRGFHFHRRRGFDFRRGFLLRRRRCFNFHRGFDFRRCACGPSFFNF